MGHAAHTGVPGGGTGWLRHPRTADQPYVVLGYRHLMRDTMLIQEQAASGRPAVVVMPAFPAVPDNDAAQLPHMWQPFASREGLHRLLLEVVHFPHRFGYGRPGADFASWQGSTAPVDGLPPFPVPGYAASAPQPPPALRNITVAGFSTAIMGVNPVLTTTAIPLPGTYPPALSGGADPAAFTAAWRELWDLDFALDSRTTGIRTADCEKGPLAWLRAGNDRRLRLYHCGCTTGNVPPAQLFPRLAKLPRTVSGPTPAPRRAEEWHDPDGRWSAVFYNSAYLQGRSSPDDTRLFFPPVPGARKTPDPAADAADAARIHPFTATLGFGHASKLRKN